MFLETLLDFAAIVQLFTAKKKKKNTRLNNTVHYLQFITVICTAL